MGGVKSVKQLDDDRLEWVAEIAGFRRQWMAKILEQVPDQKVAWAATEGATNAGVVTFEDVGGGQTSVHLSLEYEPEGLVEKVGDKLNIVENQAEADLDRFKAFIEAEGYATGAWRGSVNEGAAVGTPGVAEASSSRGDAGKAGYQARPLRPDWAPPLLWPLAPRQRQGRTLPAMTPTMTLMTGSGWMWEFRLRPRRPTRARWEPNRAIEMMPPMAAARRAPTSTTTDRATSPIRPTTASVSRLTRIEPDRQARIGGSETVTA
jgi:hypothetical protein